MKFSCCWGIVSVVSMFACLQIAASQSFVPFLDKHGRTNYAEIDTITKSVKRIHELSVNIRDYNKTENDLNPEVVNNIARSLIEDYGSILKIKWSEITTRHIDTDGQ